MAEQEPISAERAAILDIRLTENFRLLFPAMMKQDQSDGTEMTPEALVERYRQSLVETRECKDSEVSTEDALWTLFSMVSSADGGAIVKFGTALMWGERYGHGEFEPLRKLGVPVQS